MTLAPPLTASIHDSSRIEGQVTSRWPDPMSVRAALLRGSCLHRTPGLTSGTHEKAHTPGEVSDCVIHLWSRCRHRTSGHRTIWFFSAQILGPHRSYLSQPAWFICYLESVSCAQNTKILLRAATAPVASGRVLLRLSHLCTWRLSTTQLCPPTRQGSGPVSRLALSKCSKNASTVESRVHKTPVRFESPRCLSS